MTADIVRFPARIPLDEAIALYISRHGRKSRHAAAHDIGKAISSGDVWLYARKAGSTDAWVLVDPGLFAAEYTIQASGQVLPRFIAMEPTEFSVSRRDVVNLVPPKNRRGWDDMWSKPFDYSKLDKGKKP